MEAIPAVMVEMMTVEEMAKRGEEILNDFGMYSASDPFGWDWPTMSMLFPELVAEYRMLRDEYKARVANGTYVPE